jgi:hypothetical protein
MQSDVIYNYFSKNQSNMSFFPQRIFNQERHFPKKQGRFKICQPSYLIAFIFYKITLPDGKGSPD